DKHSYLFTGEGEYWKAEVRYEAREEWGKDGDDITSYDGEAAYTFNLAYKGELEELVSVKRLVYEYKLPGSGSRTSITFDDEPISSKAFTSTGSGGPIMREDHSVDVKVKWDDQEESFELVVE